MKELLLTTDRDNPFTQCSTRNQLVNTSSQTGWAAQCETEPSFHQIHWLSLLPQLLRDSYWSTPFTRRSKYLYSLRGEGGGCGLQTELEPGWKVWRIQFQWRISYLWKSGSTWRTTAREMASLHSRFLLCLRAVCLDLSSGRSTCPHRYGWMDGWKFNKAFCGLHS